MTEFWYIKEANHSNLSVSSENMWKMNFQHAVVTDNNMVTYLDESVIIKTTKNCKMKYDVDVTLIMTMPIINLLYAYPLV